MPERMDEYLRTAGEQIRWKRAREPLMRELRCHILEQRDEYIRSGMDEAKAESEAVRQMGDAETVGQELDRVHRPAPQWGLIVMAGLAAALSCAIRGFDGRAVSHAVLGFALMLGLYFLDYSFLVRHGRALYGLTLLCSAWLICTSPRVGGRIYYLQCIALFYPVVYVFWVSSFRGRCYRGFLASVLGALPLVVLCLVTPTILGFIIVMISVVATVVTAALKGWFQCDRRVLCRVLTAAAIVGVLGVVIMVIRYWHSIVQRLSVAINPYLEPQSGGYVGVILREMLHDARLLGSAGSESWNKMPNKMTDFILASIIERVGWLGFCGVMLVLGGIVVLGAVKCFKERSVLQRLLGVAVIVTIGIQLMSSAAANLGFVVIVGTCPFIGGSMHLVVNMMLVGMLISVLRTSNLPQGAYHKTGSLV